jgi:hypothetical protein
MGACNTGLKFTTIQNSKCTTFLIFLGVVLDCEVHKKNIARICIVTNMLT